MTRISTAVPVEALSRVVGYQITKGQQVEAGQNLPMRVAILGQANNANQAGLGSSPQPKQILSAQEAAETYGAGSPIHQIMRILRPVLGGGIGGIPTWVYPQLEASGAAATTLQLNVTGSANKNATHFLVVNGRSSVDGEAYQINVAQGDDADAIRVKIADALNNVLNAPVTAVNNTTDNRVDVTTKWRGASSAELDITFDTQGDNAGLAYTAAGKVDGTGVENIATSLSQFGTDWNTIVINPYGETKFVELETFNGTPSATSPTGRYTGIVFKPFVALYGSVESDRATIIAQTGAAARRNQVTNVLCPAPNSKGWTWEAAANVALLMARQAQDSPHNDVNGQKYPDMPVPSDGLIGDMADYNNRDTLVKNGASTVDLVAGQYEIQDMITTYRPAGEVPPQFRYTRNLILDWNVIYGLMLIYERFIRDRALSLDNTFVNVPNVIKPKEIRALLFTYADELGVRALIASPAFMQESILVQIDPSNPDRVNIFFRYGRTGTVRIGSFTAEANFTFN